MEKITEKAIGQVAAEDFRTCLVFEKCRIDYFNHGKQVLKEAAVGVGLESSVLIRDIEKAKESTPEADTDFNSWDLDKLAEYIVKVHHKYADQQIAIIKPHLEKLLTSGNSNHSGLSEIKSLFGVISGEIAVHQKKEELILFPYIRKMADAFRNNKAFVRPPMTKSAERPVDMLTHEHTKQGEDYKRIVELTKDYFIPSGADEDYKELIKLLKEFEANLHKHLHLENNILFPKAIIMDKEMTV